jgi:hypothetical protein
MKRDMELIRELLLAIESDCKEDGLLSCQLTPENTWEHRESICYNLKLMRDAGFIEAEQLMPDIFIKRMTWEGHEFLDSARNESIWKETMSLVQEKGGSVAIGVLTQLLSSVTKQHFGLS